MKHIFQKTHNKMATILIGFDAGARAEGTKYSPGMAHMLEHMMFKGTKKRNYLDLPKEIAFLGGSSNAFTSHEYVCYYISVPYENLDAGAEILSDMVFNSTFPEEEFLKEKEVVLEECLSGKDEVTHSLYEISMENFWSHRLAIPIIGTEESIQNFTHQELLDFYREFYDQKSAILAISGDLDAEFVAKISEKYFGPDTGFCKKVKAENHIFKPGKDLKIYRDNLEHNYVSIKYPGMNLLEDEDPAVSILTEIFGSGMDSRLFTEVREKNNLCYHIGSGNSSYMEAGCYEIMSSTRRENVTKMIDLIDHEIEKIKTELVSEEELQRSKNKLKANIYSVYDNGSRLLIENFNKAFFNLPSLFEFESKINLVTSQDILNLANKIFDPKYRMTFILDERGES